jgi:uncharacterized membrane protein
MWKKIKTRLTNPKVITAIVSGVLMILVNIGVIGEDLSAKVTDALNILLGIGVTLGVLGNPESHIEE